MAIPAVISVLATLPKQQELHIQNHGLKPGFHRKKKPFQHSPVITTQFSVEIALVLRKSNLKLVQLCKNAIAIHIVNNGTGLCAAKKRRQIEGCTNKKQDITAEENSLPNCCHETT
ncbi:CLUMA_CG014560, isoform A [Clunio marinus]|uniref:CLUMA_CG014560, isoform A n=1 Tax=Clunio marinus TaxID=568069 RepID=A0A1J1IMJ2_9DIPT|nr:CLUMA_CG014560, isoform A [Clunio marinus]